MRVFNSNINKWRERGFVLFLFVLGRLSELTGLRAPYRAYVARLIEQTGLFDQAYYLSKNGDVAISGMPPLHHYVAYGDREGRKPMAIFDPVYYRREAGGLTSQQVTVDPGHLALDRRAAPAGCIVLLR